jgi:hypothetical protein
MGDEVADLAVHIEASAGEGHTALRRLLRSRADLALVGLAIITVLIATRDIAPAAVARQLLTAQTQSVQSDPTSEPFPKLVAPGTAAPGDRFLVLGYQHRGLCASNEILLDGQAVPTQQTAIIEAALSDWDGVIFTIAIPRNAAPGPHELTLLGALPGASRGADTCVTGARPRGRIATSTLLVSDSPVTPQAQGTI